ncbi:DUF4091 domain-containing protein [Pedobacter endophyticus]|uniref:DUF4091 domain-containing protein n=1 Tax=Pedobacter endophyticus TaxID=2789740 RepID=A0A7S9KYH9_9SPHI|nr:DUF4091 domain-containing protein [Pedobacter endophyticus]QPH39197.1 DUF4091 domain-containing protein [Pedobacter endophyticus]
MKYLLMILVMGCSLSGFAQDASIAIQKSKLPDKESLNKQWANTADGLNISFANSNVRFAKEIPPAVQHQQSWSTTAWKGEKIHTQLLLWAKESVAKLSIEVSDLKDEQGNSIEKENISTGAIKYVITDEFKNGCGYRKPADFDSSYVADLIDTKTKTIVIDAKNTQPVWLSITVPTNTKTGIYSGTIQVNGQKEYKLPVKIRVLDRTLPPPSAWKYDLDLWQHPAAIARVHQVKLWSDEHFALMKPYYVMLANAGQKTITASIVDEPWGHQTYDDYPSLVKWTKKKDGSWMYDYSLFDKYVAFVMTTGIDKNINCYSMVPWKIAFTYWDEALQKQALFTDAIGTPAYNVFWKTMLTDFTKHLKAKNWFAKTYIAMDERPMEAMQAVIKLLKSVDPKWKVALAGEYHQEIEADIDNYCIASRFEFPADILQKRKQQGKTSTWYTCCTEPYPNAFSFSSPAEQVWMGWYTANKNMDGYVRWAFNSWTKNPLADTRFTAWPAGDTYMIYPGPLTSVRFEKLIEGGQDFEKIKQLQALYAKTSNTSALNELNEALGNFEIKNLSTITAADMLQRVKPLLNK